MDKGPLFFAHGKQIRLSHRLLIYVVLCSAFFTLVTTGFQLYWEYARERSAIYDTIQFIQDSYVEPVATSAFMMNEEQTRLQLKGALKLQDIVYLEVSELEDEETALVIEGDPKARRDIFKEFPLIHECFSENPFRFGMLRVAASLEGVYQRLWKKIMLILVSNAIKAFLTSFCILLIIQLVVTRHLILMAAYARKLNLDELDRELILNRSISGSSDADELDQVVTAINDMRVRMKADIAGRRKAEELLHRAYDELELKVRIRTAELTETNTRLNREIEERRHVENSLRKSEVRLNEAQQITRMGSFERNFPGGKGYWSDEYYRLLGYEPDEIPCTHDLFKKHIHPDDRDRVTQNIQEAVTHKKNYAFQFHFIRKGGDVRIGYAIGKVREDETDNSALMNGTFQDITDRVKMEAMLHEKQAQLAHSGRLALLGEMATGMAHELNQPLSIIRLDAEGLKFSLKRAGYLQSKFEENLNSVISNVDRAANIIGHMRGFARVRSAYHEKISLTESVENSLIFFREQFRHHGILLETDYEEDLPKVAADPQQFEQVVVNFLSNARYAADKKEDGDSGDYRKKVVLRLFYDKIENTVVLEIMDNGIGMTPEEKERCPEPFFTTKEVGKGTGLGLSIAHGIIKELNGRLEIESEKGIGTTMRVVLKSQNGTQ